MKQKTLWKIDSYNVRCIVNSEKCLAIVTPIFSRVAMRRAYYKHSTVYGLLLSSTLICLTIATTIFLYRKLASDVILNIVLTLEPLEFLPKISYI